ncbi:small conductance mechanosensitive channel [Alkalithermobacter thermoalcaliphilus JW-YL-7 = DSM 7308]|uniref:MscS Mechanosensitive ion channel n=1 Tax=Alkalithermobacter thermoalcaliphilus JW-YL-7 = DSM 7308 TaxID=1121328 RepID=A0A150FTG8_CLOPD|nr:MscS Mechanosensitive ion channel [[Clostridium] paradoxum JW-YL-7 = DSM 7308]SHK38121.1 small conductance mechanosensitive channel [[Clostridium] paradoxum JW-YL-7 = DSM 7308]
MLRLIKSIFIIVISFLSIRFIKYITKKVFDVTKFDIQYEKTIRSIIVSVSYYLAFFSAIILILREYGMLDLSKSTMLTGAGIIGLVAGFGTQSLIKDILNGFFILFEKQMRVGDFVVINEMFRGTVEEIGLRSTSIRDWSLRRIHIPNSEIKSIVNYNRKRMRVIVHVYVSYETDPHLVIDTLKEVCDALNEKYSEFLCKNIMNEPANPFDVYGITDIDEKNIGAKYTITGVVEPFKYWSALKDARLEILVKFREKGIKIAYPRRINMND